MKAIHVEGLSASYGDKPVILNVNVDIEKESITAIIGPNGAGKSTLLKCILDFLKPISGVVKIMNEPLNKMKSKIAYVPQISAVNWDFPITVEGVVKMGCYNKSNLFKRYNSDTKKRVDFALEQMEMSAYKKRHISQLSGGQKQRIFIARALCQEADLYIMDEPLAGVDRVSEKIIMKKLKELRSQGKTIVCVHHDLNTLKQYFTHTIMINKYIVCQGKVEDVVTPENLMKTYGESIYVE